MPHKTSLLESSDLQAIIVGIMDVLQVNFTASNTVLDPKPYTIYELEIRSSSTITWVIYKRYSDFDTVHQALLKAFPHLADTFPAVPPKRLTRSLAQEFVEQRKQELQVYLRALLKIPDVIHSDIISRWLEVPDSVRPMLDRSDVSSSGTNDIKERSMTTANASAAGAAAAEGADDGSQRSVEERKVMDLISQLKNNPNKVTALKEFEEYYFDQRPRISPEWIRILFQGEDGVNGLIATCGNVAYSQVASRAALDMLCRLLDVEKNKDAQAFLDAFTHSDKQSLKALQLHLHILSDRGNRTGAFLLVSILREKIPSLPVDVYVPDSWARQEYFRWAERNCGDGSSTVPGGFYIADPHESFLKALNLKDVSFKSIAEQAFNDIYRVAEVEDGWRAVGSQAENTDDEAVDSEPGIQITYRKADATSHKDLVVLRVMAALPHPADAVFSLLFDLGRRRDWDMKFHSGKVIECIDEQTDVVHLVFKSFSSPYKYRDFCLLRAWKRTEHANVDGAPEGDDQGYVLVVRSVVHPLVPEFKDHVRAVLLPTGYILSPCTMQTNDGTGRLIEVPACLLSYVAQMDREAVLIVSPDLLGEADDLWCSVHSFKYLLDIDAAPELAGTLPAPVSQHVPRPTTNPNSTSPALRAANTPPLPRADDASLPISHQRSYTVTPVAAVKALMAAQAASSVMSANMSPSKTALPRSASSPNKDTMVSRRVMIPATEPKYAFETKEEFNYF